MASTAEPVLLGRISGLYGVQGWVKVYSHTEPRTAILDYSEWQLRRGSGWQTAELAAGKQHGKSIVARLEGVEDRDTAAAWVGADIGVPRCELPEPEAGAWYWADLVGLSVMHRDGRVLGTVAHLLATGANDVLVVRGEREVLVPFVPESVILDIDLAAGVIKVDWEWD